MTKKKIVYGIEELDNVVEQLVQQLETCKVMTFTGSLGAGKTTLVRALLRKCGVEGTITSPTFTYVNLYENDKDQTFYHFDCYRIQSLDDFMGQGFDEYLYQPNSWVFIEWPEIVMPLLTHDVCHVQLDYHDEKRHAVIACK